MYLHKRKIIGIVRRVILTPRDGSLTIGLKTRGGQPAACEQARSRLATVRSEMGGLVYLEGSDAMGREMEAEYNIKNAHLPPEERINAYNKNMTEGGWVTKDLAALADRVGTRWLVADYEAGDMVRSTPRISSTPATMKTEPQGRIRLSTDIRYQRIRDEIDVRWMNHWSFDDML